MAPMNPDDARLIGELQARVRGLEGWLESIAADVKDIKASVDSAAGSWRFAAAFGIPAAAGAGVLALMQWLARH